MTRPADPSLARSHWAATRERGAPLLLRLTAWMAARLGRRAVQPVVLLAVAYFYCFSPSARRSIARYHARLRASGAGARLPARFAVFGQFLAFGNAILDKLQAWRGGIDCSDLIIRDDDDLHGQMGVGRGQILVGSHVGNIELCRALLERQGGATMNVLVHTRHAQAFNQLLRRAGASNLRLYQVTELDAGTMLDLNRRIDRGEWLAVAGDRIPVHGQRTVAVDFLGAQAQLPQGPWLLAGLLKCPANLLFCTRIDGRYRLALERLTQRVDWRRGQRDLAIAALAQRYADRLAQECAMAPQQWFNFFPFWNDDA